MRIGWIGMALLMATGCAATHREPPLSSNHPADPRAESAPAAPASHTLDLALADPVAHSGGQTATPIEAAPGAPSGGGRAEHAGMKPAPAATSSAPAAALYACPMHPDVTSDKPGQRCPKCGMNLQPVRGGDRR